LTTQKNSENLKNLTFGKLAALLRNSRKKIIKKNPKNLRKSQKIKKIEKNRKNSEKNQKS